VQSLLAIRFANPESHATAYIRGHRQLGPGARWEMGPSAHQRVGKPGD
jgi:hypothetical protein